MRKCVFVVGPEGSGSKLVARICSHVLGVKPYDEWNGVGSVENGRDKVRHRSLPYGDPPQFPDIEEWIRDHRDRFKIYFVLATRDTTLSEFSRVSRFGKSQEQVRADTARAKEIMNRALDSGQECVVWSYETLMFLEGSYLSRLYAFLGVTSDFSPPLRDANLARLNRAGIRAGFRWWGLWDRAVHAVRRRLRRRPRPRRP